MKMRSPHLDPLPCRNTRLFSITAALLSASSLGLWTGCASSADDRAEEVVAEERARMLYPERDPHSPTPSETPVIEQENHERTDH